MKLPRTALAAALLALSLVIVLWWAAAQSVESPRESDGDAPVVVADESARAPRARADIRPVDGGGRPQLEDGATALVGRLLEDREDFPGSDWDPVWIVFQAIDAEGVLWHIAPAGADPESIAVVLPDAGEREWVVRSVIKRNGFHTMPWNSGVDLDDGTFEVVVGVLWSGRLGVEPSPNLEAVAVNESYVRGVRPGGPVVLPTWLEDDLDPKPLDLLPPTGPDRSARFAGPVDPLDRVVCVREPGSAWVASRVASLAMVTPPRAGRINVNVSGWSQLTRPSLVLRSSSYGVAQVIRPDRRGDGKFELTGVAVGTWDLVVRETFLGPRLQQPTWAEARVVVHDTEEPTECVLDGPPLVERVSCEGSIQVDPGWGSEGGGEGFLNLLYDDSTSPAHGHWSQDSVTFKSDTTGDGTVAEFSIGNLRPGRYLARIRPYGWSGMLHAPGRDLVIAIGPPRTVEIVLLWPSTSDHEAFGGYVEVSAPRRGEGWDHPLFASQGEVKTIEVGKRYSIRTCADRLRVEVGDVGKKSELLVASADVDVPPGVDPLAVEIPMTRGGTVTAQVRLDGVPLEGGNTAPFSVRVTSPGDSHEIAPGVAFFERASGSWSSWGTSGRIGQ